MSNSLVRTFSSPDEHRDFSGGILDLISVGALTFGRETLEPGWRWSTDVRPIAGTDRCEFHHVGYQVSGRWVCEDRDGTQIEIGPGDIFDTPPGHDSWVIGDEPCVTIDFQGIADWAARGSTPRVLTTIVFADVVDSTSLIDRIGDAAWRRLQAQFFESVQTVLSSSCRPARGHRGRRPARPIREPGGRGASSRCDCAGRRPHRPAHPSRDPHR